jgi:Sec-independent protein translocase protein TatA
MSIGLGQIIVIVLLFLVLFGNLPNIFRDLAQGINYLRKAFKDKDRDKIEQGGNLEKKTSTKRKDD